MGGGPPGGEGLTEPSLEQGTNGLALGARRQQRMHVIGARGGLGEVVEGLDDPEDRAEEADEGGVVAQRPQGQEPPLEQPRTVRFETSRPRGVVRLGVIGAGNYADNRYGAAACTG